MYDIHWDLRRRGRLRLHGFYLRAPRLWAHLAETCTRSYALHEPGVASLMI